jgi:hypothetical protein
MSKFPSLEDILQACLLSVLMIPWIFFGTFITIGTIPLGALFDNGLVAVSGFVVSLTFFPILLFTYIHSVTRGKRDGKTPFIPSQLSWLEGFAQWFIAVTSSIIVIIMMSLVVHISFDTTGAFYDRDIARVVIYNLTHNKHITMFFVLVWYSIAALMFRWKRLLFKSTAKKAKNEAQTVKPEQSVNNHLHLTIDDELELLKQQFNNKKNPGSRD